MAPMLCLLPVGLGEDQVIAPERHLAILFNRLAINRKYNVNDAGPREPPGPFQRMKVTDFPLSQQQLDRAIPCEIHQV